MLGQLFILAVVLQFILAIFDFLGGRYFDGAFDLIFVLVGAFAVKSHPMAYSYQQVMCYMFLNGFNTVWAVLRLILYLAGVAAFAGPKGWVGTFYMITIGAGPAVYLYATVVAYKLYKELKSILYNGADMQQGGDSGDGYGAAPYRTAAGAGGPAQRGQAAPQRQHNWGASSGQQLGDVEDGNNAGAGQSYLVSAPRGHALGSQPARSSSGAAASGTASGAGSGFHAFTGYAALYVAL